jgi:hypothetical protein
MIFGGISVEVPVRGLLRTPGAVLHENLEMVTARNPWERIRIGQSAPRSHQEQ